MISEPRERIWQVFVDGASNCQRAGAGMILISPKEIKVEKSFRLGFLMSNNEAEYEAFFAGLRMSRQVGAKRVQVHCDSWLVISQIFGEFEAKDQRMMNYLKDVGILKS